jgi:hypothetical protein
MEATMVPANPTTPPISLAPTTPPPTILVPTASPITNTDEVYAVMCAQIIKDQALIIGSLALEQARHVAGLTFDPTTHACSVTGDGVAIVELLINRYRNFFGDAAVEVCKEAAARFMIRLPAEKVPISLR